jgi:hypothetical protein
MPRSTRNRKRKILEAANARLAKDSIKENADYNLVRSIAADNAVPTMASTNSLNSAYKVVALSEAAKVISANSTSTNQASSSSTSKKQEIRSSISDTIDDVHGNLTWESLTSKWNVLQTAGSEEYSPEVLIFISRHLCYFHYNTYTFNI